MDPLTLAIGGAVIGAAASGIQALMSGGAKAEKDKRDAALLNQQINNISELQKKGRIDTAEAISRIEAAKNNASASVREAINNSVTAAMSSMTRQFSIALEDQQRNFDRFKGQLDDAGEQHRKLVTDQLENYRKNMKQQMQGLTDSFTTRRLGGSGAMIAAFNQQREQQGKQEKAVLSDAQQFQENLNKQIDNAFADFAARRATMQMDHEGKIADLNLNAGAELGRQLSGIEQGFTNMAEARRSQGQQMEYGLETQKLSLQAGRDAAQGSADSWNNGGWAGALASPAIGMIGQIGSQIASVGTGNLIGQSLIGSGGQTPSGAAANRTSSVGALPADQANAILANQQQIEDINRANSPESMMRGLNSQFYNTYDPNSQGRANARLSL
jgi:hypothetical protein